MTARGWIHRYTALQQCKEKGIRPVVFQRDGGFYVLDLPFNDDWAQHAAANPGTLRVLCGVTGITLWPDPHVANDNGRPAA